MKCVFALLGAHLVCSAVAPATAETDQPLPQPIVRMISVAASSADDEAELNAVIAAAKLAYPSHVDQIDALAGGLSVHKAAPALKLSPSVVRGVVPPPVEQDWSYFRGWDGQVSLSAAFADGNTNTSNFGLRTQANRAKNGRIDRLTAYADTSENNGRTSQRKWGLSFQSDLFWTEDVYGYARVSIEADPFAGFDRRSFVGAGAGTKFIESEKLNIRGEIGPGYRFTEFANDEGEDYEVVAYGAFNASWVALEDWRLQNDAKLTLSSDSSTFESTTSVRTTLTDVIRTGLSYQLRYETNPPNDRLRRDSIVRLNLSYGF